MRSKIILALLSICFFTNAQQLMNYQWSGGMGDPLQDDYMNSSAVDGAGNTIIAGRMQGTVDFDPGPGVASYTDFGKAYIAKYDNTGAYQWVAIFTGTGICAVNSIDVDAADNIYATGYFQSGDIDFDAGPGTFTMSPSQSDMFIVKYNAAGVFQWAKQVGQVSTTVDGLTLKVTPTGSIYIAGSFNFGGVDFDPGPGSANLVNYGFTDIFLLKLDNAGLYQWVIGIGDASGDQANALDVDANGDVVVCGAFNGAPDFDYGPGTTSLTCIGFDDMFVMKYSSAGNFIWAGSIAGSSGYEVGYCVKLTSTGDVLIGGTSTSATLDIDPSATVNSIPKAGVGSQPDMYLGLLSGSNGAFIWGKNAGGIVQGNAVIPRCIALDGTSNFWVTGSFGDFTDLDLNAGTYTMQPINLPGEDIFFSQYNISNANFLNAYQLGGGNSSPGSTGVFMKIVGNNVYLTGEITKDTDMDPGPASTVIIPGGKDFFVAKYTKCQLPQIGGLSNPGFVCAGTTLTLSVTSGTLNDAINWQWYNSGCGVGSLGAGLNVTTTAVSNTTYYVRGEGGCVPGGMTCLTTTVTVAPLTSLSGALTNPSVSPVNGTAILFKYEPMFTKFDTTVKQILVGGNYSINAVPAGTYILMANPTATNLQVTYSGDQTGWKSAQTFTHGCLAPSVHNINVAALTTFTGAGSATLTGKIVEGAKYGQKGAHVTVPGNPIKGLTVKGGRNPGGNVGAQDRTKPDGTYTLTGLPINITGESYFILVDIPGLDTNGTYHKVIVTGTEVFSNLDFVIDSAKVVPQVFVGVKENKMQNASYKIYPNPTTGKLFILFSQNEPGKISISLTDIAGKIISEILPEIFESSKEVTIVSDQSALKPGIYFLKVRSQNKESVTKLIISE